MLTKIIVKDKEYTFEEYLNLENEYSYPYPIRKLIVNNNSKKRKSWLSPSGFGSCYRKLYWNYIYDYSETQENLYITSRGTLIHKLLEDITPNNKSIFKEIDLEFDFNYFKLYGTLDLIKDSILYDYKTIKDDKISKIQLKYPYNNIIQLNIYKMMAESQLNITIKDIKIVFISMSGLYVSGQNLNNIKLPQFPIYSNDKIIKYIEKQTEFIKNKEEIPWKSDYCHYCRWYNKCFKKEKEIFF